MDDCGIIKVFLTAKPAQSKMTDMTRYFTEGNGYYDFDDETDDAYDAWKDGEIVGQGFRQRDWDAWGDSDRNPYSTEREGWA